jgi:hypothetical protein
LQEAKRADADSQPGTDATSTYSDLNQRLI